uniref:Uncharacterized protein n=1 Tax=Opuntia streptacantha TaxID=393608 RepID=A0A7C8Z8R7_OPUST
MHNKFTINRKNIFALKTIVLVPFFGPKKTKRKRFFNIWRSKFDHSCEMMLRLKGGPELSSGDHYTILLRTNKSIPIFPKLSSGDHHRIVLLFTNKSQADKSNSYPFHIK